MTSQARRPLSQILSFLTSLTTPIVSALMQLYSTKVSLIPELFALNSGSMSTQGTPYMGLAKYTFYAGDDFGSSAMSTFTNAGAATSLFTSAVAGAPGVVAQSVSALAVDRSTINPSASLVSTLAIGTSIVVFDSRCQTVLAQDGTEQWSDRWGLGDNTAGGDATDGVYFESDRATYGDNDVRLCASNGGARTKTSMGVAPTAATFQRWKLVINAAGTSVQGFLNDTATGAAVVTNLPATTVGMGVWWAQVVKTLGVTARIVQRDYLECYQMYSTGQR